MKTQRFIRKNSTKQKKNIQENVPLEPRLLPIWCFKVENQIPDVIMSCGLKMLYRKLHASQLTTTLLE